ncbi:synaptonemal complex protein 2-like [Athene noctua]|uniref:synaptonemal complex protein 2-like n=1 Tax=Athene noctua TaxID=126797 RepID=UPI003EB8D80A
MLLLEDFFDTALVICKCSNKGEKEVLNLFLPELGHLVTEANISSALRQETLRTLNSILDSVSREERKKFPLSEEMCLLTKDLAKTMLEVGDYDLQVALSEAVCRLMTKKWRDDFVHQWFEDDYLAEAFKEIKDREFETDCRKFLNRLNERLGDKRRVYSFPCISAFADMNEVKKPSDEKLEGFWIDFNTGSQSVTFYVDSDEGALWEPVRLLKEAISSYSLKEYGGEKIVKIYMKIPATWNKTEATKIKISFSAEFEILSILRKVLGDEKMMINVVEEESVHSGKQARQNEAVMPESTNPQGRTSPSNSANTEMLSDNLVSQHSPELRGTVAKTVNSVTMITVSQQGDVEDANQHSAKNSKTPSPRMKAKPSERLPEEKPMDESTPKVVTWEMRNRKTRLAKQNTEGRKGVYDFENSDSASHEKVAEAKEKIFGQKDASQNQRNHETGNKNEESNKLKKSLSNYRKHLFSESNSENASTGQSEKSWILDSQQPSLPKSLDYTRKRQRVRSKLKVLPVSPASSSSDYQTKEQKASRQRAQKEKIRKKSSKGDNLPTVDLTDEMLSEELKGDPLSLDASAMGSSSDEEKATQKFHDAYGKVSKEKGSFKRKDSGILSGTVIKKPKFSSLETSNLSFDASYKPRKLFDLVEKEVGIQTGKEMDNNVDDAFFSKLLHEELSDTLLITAFESLISQLNKRFWSQYKRMETSVQNSLRTSEKNLSTLLNQIHECRLSKLETFYKIVVEDLASLEKENQVLANIEKEAVDYWNMQLLKLNAFCNQQKQRIQSVDSGLGETAGSFADTIQNTTRLSLRLMAYDVYDAMCLHCTELKKAPCVEGTAMPVVTTYEQPMKKAVENVVIGPTTT